MPPPGAGCRESRLCSRRKAGRSPPQATFSTGAGGRRADVYKRPPVDRRNFTFQADDRGDFFHAALSAFVTVAAQTGAWPERMEEAGVNAVMDEVVAPLMAQWTDGPLGEDARSRALGRRYVETVKRAAWLFTDVYKRQVQGAVVQVVPVGGGGDLRQGIGVGMHGHFGHARGAGGKIHQHQVVIGGELLLRGALEGLRLAVHLGVEVQPAGAIAQGLSLIHI